MTTYRTAGVWGAGKGADLIPSEVDENFWGHEQRLVATEGATPEEIDHFAVAGDQFYVHMSDARVLGPYQLPVLAWNFRGAWQAATVYANYDVVTAVGSVYQVLFDHTSASSFDPGANDGLGNDYYGLLLESSPAAPQNISVVDSFDPTLDHANGYLRIDGDSPVTITIPNTSDEPFPLGSELNFRQVSEALIFEAASGVTLIGIEGRALTTDTIGAVATAKKVGGNTWDLFGMLAPE